MVVELTSEALGKAVGDTHAGPEEAWLLAHGYAKQAAYVGPGVANIGVADTTPANDVTAAVNREPEPSRDKYGRPDPGRLDPAMDYVGGPNTQEPFYDFDAGGINLEIATVASVDPNELPLAGGVVVTIEGQNFKGTTAVNFGVTPGTALEVVSDSKILVTAPAKTAGPYDVDVVNANGTGTLVAGVTYA